MFEPELPLEPASHLLGLVQAEQAVVDEDAGQAVADGPVEEERGHRRVHPAAQPADHPAVAHLLADAGGGLLEERGHGPVAAAAADGGGEVPQDVDAALGVGHLGMEEQRVEAPGRVFHGRDRRVRARRRDPEAVRDAPDAVAVAGPDPDLARKPVEEGAARLGPHGGVTELALGRRLHLSPQDVGHQLHAVADAEHRHPEGQHPLGAPGRLGLADARRPPGENQPGRPPGRQLVDRGVKREDLGIEIELAQSTGDQLGVLRSEVEHEQGLMGHAGDRMMRDELQLRRLTGAGSGKPGWPAPGRRRPIIMAWARAKPPYLVVCR